jgi:hypothetical protein
MDDLILEFFKKMFIFFKIKLLRLSIMCLAAFDDHKLIDILIELIQPDFQKFKLIIESKAIVDLRRCLEFGIKEHSTYYYKEQKQLFEVFHATILN